MPGANEVLGCPGQGKSLNFFVVKKSTFSEQNLHFVPKKISICLPKFLTTFFTMIIFTELCHWMPPGWIPRAVAPSAPPLHATVSQHHVIAFSPSFKRQGLDPNSP